MYYLKKKSDVQRPKFDDRNADLYEEGINLDSCSFYYSFLKETNEHLIIYNKDNSDGTKVLESFKNKRTALEFLDYLVSTSGAGVRVTSLDAFVRSHVNLFNINIKETITEKDVV